MKVRFDFTTVKHQSASLLVKLCPDSPKVHEWRTKSFQIDRGWFIFFITLPDQFYWVSITGGTVCYVLLVQLVFA